MTDFPKLSEGILGEEDIPKTNTELFLALVGQYFPEAIKDGEVDFTALKEEMGEFAEVGAEHYDFTWAGKQAAKKEAMADIFGRSLRYKPQDSLNPDSTENLYIEGDNLEALKLLRRNYHGKIKMIYIDPPYNTGSDFVYRDDFSMTQEELDELSGDVVDGVRFQKNAEGGSRYHTNWLNMMYPRLRLAKELLSDDGVIFISIDDHEVENLTQICNNVFGESNQQAIITYVRKTSGKQDSTNFMRSTEYIVVYSKSDAWDCSPIIAEEKVTDRFNKTDEDGRAYRETDLRKTGNADRREDRPLMWYPFYFNPATNDLIVSQAERPDLVQNGYVEIYPIKPDKSEGRWRWGFSSAQENIANLVARIMPKYKAENKYTIYEMDYIDKNGDVKTVKEHTYWDRKPFNSDNAMQEFKALGFSNQLFPFPKSCALIKHMIYLANCDDAIILDFFSGSATTAQAVMQLNAENGGHRKFIMVQLQELTEENSEAYKAGYKNICEIGKERIRRAAKKIHEEHPEAQFDDGFKVFEVGNTTIRWNTADDEAVRRIEDIDYSTGMKDDIDFTAGHNDIDIVYEIMLRQYGIPLSTPIERLDSISDRTYIFADSVVVCLDPEITTELIEKLAAIEPTPAKYILRDSAFNDDIELKDVSFRRLSALVQNHQPEAIRKSKYNNFTVEFI